MDYKVQWFKASKIKDEHALIKVNQVYIWILTGDKKLIIVSKDGENWQFPGGHPKRGESTIQTAVREIEEETGLNISDQKAGVSVFGYYCIDEFDGRDIKETFIQMRAYLKLDKDSSQLKLGVLEKEDELEKDKIRFVRTVTLNEALKLIPWLKTKDEYLALIEMGFFGC